MHLIKNKGLKSECMKFGENSRQMPSVSTIFDEYCRHVLIVCILLLLFLNIICKAADLLLRIISSMESKYLENKIKLIN